jgi:hypothetical protein
MPVQNTLEKIQKSNLKFQIGLKPNSEQKVQRLPAGLAPLKLQRRRSMQGTSQWKFNQGFVDDNIITINWQPETRNLFLPSRP